MAEEPQEQSGEQMVTIERFRDMVQAEMAKGRLDSAGIRSFLAGENAGLLYGNGLDGVLLQVSARRRRRRTSHPERSWNHG